MPIIMRYVIAGIQHGVSSGCKREKENDIETFTMTVTSEEMMQVFEKFRSRGASLENVKISDWTNRFGTWKFRN